jgi:translation elongation factor EF-Ts
MSACIDPDPVVEVMCLQDVSERGRSGRIESYLHSDAITPNKGGSLVKITCDTDFAARTTEFYLFARSAAKFAYASSAKSWSDIVATYPEMLEQLDKLRTVLGERVEVTDVVVMKI